MLVKRLEYLEMLLKLIKYKILKQDSYDRNTETNFWCSEEGQKNINKKQDEWTQQLSEK